MRFPSAGGCLVVVALSASNFCAAGAARAAEPRASAARALTPGWLGVQLSTKASLAGVDVERVTRASPADRAGLRAGDRILEVDGVLVQSSSEVTRAVVARGAGAKLALRISRGSVVVLVTADLEARPTNDEMVRREHVGQFAPPWVGTTPVGRAPKSLAELKGRVVLIDFWASFCGPCRYIAPAMSRLSLRYEAQGLRVVGVTMDEPEVAASAALRFGMQYPTLLDTRGETTRSYAVNGLPTMFLVDRRGVVRDVYVGYSQEREAEIESRVKTLLAEPVPSEPSGTREP